jgi:hypothetical protein
MWVVLAIAILIFVPPLRNFEGVQSIRRVDGASSVTVSSNCCRPTSPIGVRSPPKRDRVSTHSAREPPFEWISLVTQIRAGTSGRRDIA